MKILDRYIMGDWMDSIRPLILLPILVSFLVNGIVTTYTANSEKIIIELNEGMEGESGSDKNENSKDKGSKDKYSRTFPMSNHLDVLQNISLADHISKIWGIPILEIPSPPPESVYKA